MTILSLLLIIVVCGVILYFVNAYLPMEPRVKNLLNIVVVVFLAILALVFLLGVLGVDTGAHLRLS